MTTMGTDDAVPAVEHSPWILARGPFTRRVLRQEAYLFGSCVGGLAALVAMTVLLVAGASLLVVAVGLPLLFAAFPALRAFSGHERRRILRLTGDRIPTPYREAPSGGMLARLLGYAADPATWRDLTYLVVAAATAMASTIVMLCCWGLVLGAASLPVWYRYLPEHAFPLIHRDGREYLLTTTPPIVAVCAAAFAIAWILTPTLMELGTRIQVGLGRVLLGLGRAELERREQALRVSRGQAVSAAEAERRRIERDLHDGAQQRLVALAMDLGMAKAKLASGEDPQAAARLVAEAHEGVKLALAELRDLARGIHPAVLTDRGLDAALSALAGRSPVPVEVDAALAWRPSPEIESAAYFVASEALANTAKHAHATRAWIELEHRAGHLRLIIGDDGLGGARPGSAGGLAGLADRVAPLDGTLAVSSPAGGPTLVVMEVPCEPPVGS